MNGGDIIIPAVAGDGSLYPVEKMQAHIDGVLHLAVSVFVFDGDLLLVQHRAAVDLPVPRSPKIRTPPSSGSTAAISNACFIACWATMAENGKGFDMTTARPVSVN